jgi:hypothetical protein
VSAQAARALALRLRLPRQKANDGKTLVMVDMDEIDHKPKPAAVRSSGDDHAWRGENQDGGQKPRGQFYGC